MSKEKPAAFPMLPVKHWWTLREKFKRTIPGTVTANYIATTLNMGARSAQANIVPYLKTLGLIDDEGKTQDLAAKWRDDEQYSGVCEVMRKKIYPDELISAVPNPNEDRAAVERWFANHTRAGTAAVQRMAAIYMVISEGDLNKRPTVSPEKEVSRKKIRTEKKTATKSKPPTGREPAPGSPAQEQAPLPAAPGVSINLEIHVSSDATPDQIDKIFESMAKHIYKKL